MAHYYNTLLSPQSVLVVQLFFTVPVYRGSPWHPLFLQNKHTSCVSGNLLTICETRSRSKYPFLTE